MTEKCLFAKTCRLCKARDRFTGLKVWIEDHFNNSKNTARFQSAENFRESLHTIGNFPEDSNQHHTIEIIFKKHPFPNGCGYKTHVCATCRFRLDLRPGKHSWLNIKRNYTTIPANTLGQRNRETSGPTTGIQDLHSLGQAKSFNNKSSPVRFGKRVVKLHKPTQPYRAWKMPPIGGYPPYDSREGNYGDSQKDYDGFMPYHTIPFTAHARAVKKIEPSSLRGNLCANASLRQFLSLSSILDTYVGAGP